MVDHHTWWMVDVEEEGKEVDGIGLSMLLDAED